MKKTPAKVSEAMEALLTQLTGLYVAVMLLLFPLFYRNKLFDIIEAKRDLYLLVTGILLAAAVLPFLAWAVKEREGRKTAPARRSTDLWFPGIFMACLAAASLLGTLACGAPADSFWGINGWRCIGCVVFLTGPLVSLLIGRFLRWEPWLTWCLLVSTAVEFILEWCSQWQIDPLGMTAGVLESEKVAYIGTIGQFNYVSVFNGMAIAALMVLFYLCRERISLLVYGACLFLGYGSVFCCRTNGIFLGVGAAFALMFGCVFHVGKRLGRAWLMGALFFAASLCVKLLCRLFAARTYPLDHVGTLFLQMPLLAAELVFLVLLGALIAWMQKSGRNCRIVSRIYWGAFVGGIALAALLFVLATKGAFPEGSLLSAFCIDESFGTGRGRIWRNALQLYGKYPLWNKLFGCGIDRLRFALAQYAIPVLSSDAHSEWIHLLDSVGLVGVTGYFGMLLSVLVRCFRRMREQEAAVLGVIGLGAYLIQGLVNGPQIVTIPLLFVELGICIRVAGKQ